MASHSEIVTVITNTSGTTKVFGFLPPHGKELEPNESVTIKGDLRAQLTTCGGSADQRKRIAYDQAISDDLIRSNTNNRISVTGAVNSGTTITAGDLVYLDTDDIKPASSFPWTSNLETTQENFADVFLGVAVDSHVPADGAVTNFRVDTSPSSIYTFTCSSETHEIGDTMGPAKASGNSLLNTKLETAVASSSIARVTKKDGSATTSVSVRIQSAYLGSNAAGVVPVLHPPVNIAPPSITGETVIGETLTAVAGTWTNSPVLTYLWLHGDDSPAGGPDTGTTYELTEDDEGFTMKVIETATNDDGTDAVESEETDVVVWLPNILDSNIGMWVIEPGHVWQDAGGTVPAGLGDLVARIDDQSGFNNHLLASGSARGTLAIDEGNAYCITLNGTANNYRITSLALGSNAFTVTVIFTLDTAAFYPYMFVYGPGENNLGVTDTSRPHFFESTAPGGDALSADAIDTDIAFTCTATSGVGGNKLRINGVQKASVVGGATQTSTANVFVGCYDGAQLFWPGRFYGGALYNEVLAAEFLTRTDDWAATLPGIDLELLAEYAFDDGSGTTLTDSSGNDNHGTLGPTGSEAPTWDSDGLVFSATTNGTAVEVPLALLTDSKTIMFFGSVERGHPFQTVLASRTAPSTMIGFGNDDASFGVESPPRQGSSAPTSGLPVEGDLAITMVFGSDPTIYYGDEETPQYLTKSPEPDFSTATSPAWIGQWPAILDFGPGLPNVNVPFIGHIYYMVFYAQPLNAAQVAAKVAAVTDILSARGITLGNTIPNRQVVAFCGDSVTEGVGASGAFGPYPANTMNQLSNTYNHMNCGAGGTYITEMPVPDALLDLYGESPNVCIIYTVHGLFEGFDFFMDQIRDFWAARRAAGWLVIATTLTDQSTLDAPLQARRMAINDAIRDLSDEWDALMDLGADEDIGVEGACFLGSPFFIDSVHLSNAGYDVVAGYAVTALDELGFE